MQSQRNHNQTPLISANPFNLWEVHRKPCAWKKSGSCLDVILRKSAKVTASVHAFSFSFSLCLLKHAILDLFRTPDQFSGWTSVPRAGGLRVCHVCLGCALDASWRWTVPGELRFQNMTRVDTLQFHAISITTWGSQHWWMDCIDGIAA